MDYKGILFDFDYTLGDATEAIHQAFVYALTTMGYPAPDRESVRHTIGMVVSDAYTLLTGDATTEGQEKFYSLFHPVSGTLQGQGQVELFPGTVELLSGLKAAGLSTGLISTKNVTVLQAVAEVKGLSGLLDVLVGGGTVQSHKPDPEGLLWAMDKLGLKREDVLFCGDTTIDAETAQNAGVDFCAVLNGTPPAEAFSAYPSVHISPDLWDLKSWLGV